MAVTIKKIAEIVGVSRGTVDRALHNRYGVDPETKARVERAAKELGYRPNPTARALKKAEDPLTFGVIIPSSENRFYLDIHKGLKKAEETYRLNGVKLHVIEEKLINEKNQIEHIEQLVEKKVDGIALAAIDTPLVKECINAVPENIPIVTYNTDIRNTNRLCFVGQNHLSAGRVAGDLMCRTLREQGNIMMLISHKEMLAHTERVDGFTNKLLENGYDQKHLHTFEVYESDLLAYKVVADCLKNEEDLAGIFVAGGGQTGAGNALADSGKSNEIQMICFDTLPETIQFIKDGVVDFTIAQDPFMQGFLPIKILYELITLGIKPKKEKLLTHIDIRVKDNVDLKGLEFYTGYTL